MTECDPLRPADFLAALQEVADGIEQPEKVMACYQGQLAQSTGDLYGEPLTPTNFAESLVNNYGVIADPKDIEVLYEKQLEIIEQRKEKL